MGKASGRETETKDLERQRESEREEERDFFTPHSLGNREKTRGSRRNGQGVREAEKRERK